MTISEVRKTRKKLGISQTRLAKLIKKTPSFICKLEHGNRVFHSDLKKQIKETLAKVKKAAK
jgi:predicted transcriptional regulator